MKRFLLFKNLWPTLVLFLLKKINYVLKKNFICLSEYKTQRTALSSVILYMYMKFLCVLAAVRLEVKWKKI